MSEKLIQTNQARTQRVYVKVTSNFDTTGFMQPIAITLVRWPDLPYRTSARIFDRQG